MNRQSERSCCRIVTSIRIARVQCFAGFVGLEVNFERPQPSASASNAVAARPPRVTSWWHRFAVQLTKSAKINWAPVLTTTKKSFVPNQQPGVPGCPFQAKFQNTGLFWSWLALKKSFSLLLNSFLCRKIFTTPFFRQNFCKIFVINAFLDRRPRSDVILKFAWCEVRNTFFAYTLETRALCVL